MGTNADRYVLVVDDMAFMRRILCNALDKLGLRSMEATNAKEAIRQVKNDPPALIFLDIVMPNGDGIEVCRWVRSQKDEHYRSIPIIICSVHRERKDIARAIAAGANDYLVKPVTSDSLKERLAKHLPGWHDPDTVGPNTGKAPQSSTPNRP
ncbi:MAG TPA: response regulator [Candidatus Hydrogenedentes bacterium]|nr:response regulator [Candidatus Hydrogenedentota bacterium]HPG66175.1 response regulator [Candidatus Hydrogenedentota bacterium]